MFIMTKKRKNGGKRGSDQGRSHSGFLRSNCGRLTPRGKAKKVTRYISLMEGVIAKELREAGAIIPREKSTQWLCISCAIHSHAIGIRPNADRKKKKHCKPNGKQRIRLTLFFSRIT